MAALPTGFGKSLNFSDVCHDARVSKLKKTKNKLLEYHRDFSITKHHMRDQVSGLGKFYGNDSL